MPLLPALALNPTVAALSAGAALAYAVLAWALAIVVLFVFILRRLLA